MADLLGGSRHRMVEPGATKPYNVCMANRHKSSAPLFGAPTGRQVKAVQDDIDAYTAKLIKDVKKARKIFEKTEPKAEADDPAAVDGE